MGARGREQLLSWNESISNNGGLKSSFELGSGSEWEGSAMACLPAVVERRERLIGSFIGGNATKPVGKSLLWKSTSCLGCG